ncbi:MAG: hypothetical protein PHW02_05570 [bacterium]|nr:hypothetical protein [bacterium]
MKRFQEIKIKKSDNDRIKLRFIAHFLIFIVLILLDGCLLTLHPEIQREREVTDEHSIAVLNNNANAALKLTEDVNIGLNPSFTRTKNIFYRENSIGMDAMLNFGFINGLVSTGLFYYNNSAKFGLKIAPCLIGEFIGVREYNSEAYSCYEYGLIMELDINYITLWMMKNRGAMIVSGIETIENGMFDSYTIYIDAYDKMRTMYGINYNFGGESGRKYSLFANIGFESSDLPDTSDNIFSNYYSVAFGLSVIVENVDVFKVFRI